jgi:predicted MFS family arabinose efflux permease
LAAFALVLLWRAVSAFASALFTVACVVTAANPAMVVPKIHAAAAVALSATELAVMTGAAMGTTVAPTAVWKLATPDLAEIELLGKIPFLCPTTF